MFEAARKQKIPMVAIRPDDVAKVDELPIGNLAREGMKRQLATGKELLVPARAPTGEDGATIGYAWYVWDATTGRLTACLPDGADGFVFTAIHTKLSAKYLGWTESILIAFDCYLLSYAGSLVEHAGEDMSWGMYDAVARVEALSLTKSVFMNAAFGGAASLAQWQIGVILANLWLNAITPD